MLKCRNTFLLLLILFKVSIGISQVKISGRVTDEQGKPLENASIILHGEEEKLLSYAISNDAGYFSVEAKNSTDFLILKVSYLGYIPQAIELETKDQELEVKLKLNSEDLEEVKVETFPVEKRGDTINYSVSAFTNGNDRVIADVLQKMPGITVEADGRILYKGEPIQKFYIEGLDLLEGKYNLASNNLPAKAVSRVQILENHQPVKVLDSLVFSEKTSLNIKLKDEVTTSGTGTLGMGAAPLLWKANITPMLFKKDLQAIISYQSNNTGTDVSSDLQRLVIREPEKSFSPRPTNLLGLLNIQKPPFPQELWRDNHIHLSSANFLTQLKNNSHLKINLSYINDAQQTSGHTITKIFSPTQDISFEEVRKNKAFSEEIDAGIILERNLGKSYFKNELQVLRKTESKNGKITDTTDNPFLQELENPFSAFENRMEWLQPFGKQLITFNSHLGFQKISEKLRVSPGPFPEVLNYGETYPSALQKASFAQFYLNTSAGITKKLNNLSLSSRGGIEIDRQELNSKLISEKERQERKPNTSYSNKLHLISADFYLNSEANYEIESWKLKLQFPISSYSFRTSNTQNSATQKFTLPVFEPKLLLQKEFGHFLEGRLLAGRDQNFGNAAQLYSAYILTDMRRLQKFEGLVAKDIKQHYRALLSYRNPLRSLFGNISYTFSRTRHNLLIDEQFDEEGASTIRMLERKNTSNSHRWKMTASTYLNRTGTSFKIGTEYNIFEKDRILNSEAIPINNNTLRLEMGIDTELTSKVRIAYKGIYSFFQTSLGKIDTNKINYQHHTANAAYFPAENQYLQLSGSYYDYSGRKGDLFMNLNYQYTFTKTGLDLNLSWNNILNKQYFLNVYSSEQNHVETRYKLRPSQVLASLRFSF